MSSNTDLFIDNLCIDSAETTSDTSYLTNVPGSIHPNNNGKTTGYKWLLEIKSNTDDIVHLENWRMNIAVHYTSDGTTEQIEHSYINFKDMIATGRIIYTGTMSALPIITYGDPIFAYPTFTIGGTVSNTEWEINSVGTTGNHPLVYNNLYIYRKNGPSIEPLLVYGSYHAKAIITTYGTSGYKLGLYPPSWVVWEEDERLYFKVGNTTSPSASSNSSTINLPHHSSNSDLILASTTDLTSYVGVDLHKDDDEVIGTLNSTNISLQGRINNSTNQGRETFTIGYDDDSFSGLDFPKSVLGVDSSSGYFVNYPNANASTGNTNAGSALGGQTSSPLYLIPSASSTYYYSTQFILQYSDNAFSSYTDVDVLGWNSTNNIVSNEYTNTILKSIISNSSQSINRKRVNMPSSTFSVNDWEFKSTSNTIFGDPHVTTLSGDHYHFNYLGAFRLLDNNDKIHPVIMNGQSEYGPGRWSERQYIRKVYIYEHGKSIIVDLGFRGSKATILYNEGFTITEKELPFHSTARMYCVDNHMSFLDREEAIEYEKETGYRVPGLIRNEINIFTQDLDIKISNVNEYNLQPCRVLNIPKQSTTNWTGCSIDIKYATNCMIKNMYDLSEIGEPSIVELETMPAKETPTYIQNSRWK